MFGISMLVVVVLLISVSEHRCAEIHNGQRMERNMVAIPQTKPFSPLGMFLTPSSLEAIMSMLNRTGDNFPPMGDMDLDRMKRAQGPITELYGCLLTLFLNPACWNRFENNQLRYLQYIYLRRRLKMLEQARAKGMNVTSMAGAEPKKQGKEAMPVGPTASPGPPPELPPHLKLIMRYFPHLFKKMAYVQTKVKGVRKVVGTQVAQAKGVAMQTFGAVATKLKAAVPVVQQRAMTFAGQAVGHGRGLMQQALAVFAPPLIPSQPQGKGMKPVKKN